MNLQVTHIGNEGQPVVVIDDVLPDPSLYLEIAAEAEYAERGPYYPGIRAPVPGFLLRQLVSPLRTVLQEDFGYQKAARVRECNFSILTREPSALLPIQTMPHFDGVEPDTLAILLYLSRQDHGGTAFYRHRSTGFETITAERHSIFHDTLQAELTRDGLPPKDYVRGDTPQFEQIHAVEARFNRMLVYRGITLHSGNPSPDFKPDFNPRTGRLTVNMFLLLSD